MLMMAIAYAIYKLKSPLAGASQAVSQATEKVKETYFYISEKIDTRIHDVQTYKSEFHKDQSQGETQQQAEDAWTAHMKKYLGKDAPAVIFPTGSKEYPEKGEIPSEVDQGSVSSGIPAAPDETPELTPEIERMLFQPRSGQVVESQNQNIQNYTPGVAPSKRGAWQPTPQPQSISPSRQTPATVFKPRSSLSEQEAAAQGWRYSTAIGQWYK